MMEQAMNYFYLSSAREKSDTDYSILDRNGVGRSTILKAIMGDVPPRRSSEAIAGPKPYEIAHRGIGYVPEDRAILLTPIDVSRSEIHIARVKRSASAAHPLTGRD